MTPRGARPPPPRRRARASRSPARPPRRRPRPRRRPSWRSPWRLMARVGDGLSIPARRRERGFPTWPEVYKFPAPPRPPLDRHSQEWPPGKARYSRRFSPRRTTPYPTLPQGKAILGLRHEAERTPQAKERRRTFRIMALLLGRRVRRRRRRKDCEKEFLERRLTDGWGGVVSVLAPRAVCVSRMGSIASTTVPSRNKGRRESSLAVKATFLSPRYAASGRRCFLARIGGMGR